MLSQMDPALVAYCDKIAAQGGPSQMPEGYGDSALVQTPVVQTLAVTRASARLRNVQPEVNLGQTYEVLKKPKKNVESISTGIILLPVALALCWLASQVKTYIFFLFGILETVSHSCRRQV